LSESQLKKPLSSLKGFSLLGLQNRLPRHRDVDSVASQRLKNICLHGMVSFIRRRVVETKQLGDRDGFEHVQVQLSEDVVKAMGQVQLLFGCCTLCATTMRETP
jgi:hypothetical protein